MGLEAAKQVSSQMGVYPDSQLQRYVNSLGMTLARASERPSLPWSFTVIDDPVVNAFALPGGPIFITRGILGGEIHGPKRDAVLLNAAFALSTECGDLPAGLEEARQSIDSGAALRVLDAYVRMSQSFAHGY